MLKLQKTEIFHHSLTVSVSINAPPKKLYELLTDIVNLDRFFPEIEFKLARETPLSLGSIYFTKPKNAKSWSTYRVGVLLEDYQMSAMLTGFDPIFSAMKYTHKFIPTETGTISHETIDYSFRFGLFGRLLNLLIGKRLVKKQVLSAHENLKKYAEAKMPNS